MVSSRLASLSRWATRVTLSRPSTTSSRTAVRQFSAKPAVQEDEPVVVGPGGPSDRILGMYEQSAGLERLEYLSNLAQRPLFLMNPLKIEKFGTLKEPVPVESISGHRIVGCSGFPVDSHELMWFECDVEKGPGRCPECGQAFAIQLVNQHLH